MADRLLELLRGRETSGAFAKLQTPRYMDAMVLSRGTVADITTLRQPEAKPNVFQTYSVAVNGTTISPRVNFSGPPEFYLEFDYVEDDFVDDYTF